MKSSWVITSPLTWVQDVNIWINSDLSGNSRFQEGDRQDFAGNLYSVDWRPPTAVVVIIVGWVLPAREGHLRNQPVSGEPNMRLILLRCRATRWRGKTNPVPAEPTTVSAITTSFLATQPTPGFEKPSFCRLDVSMRNSVFLSYLAIVTQLMPGVWGNSLPILAGAPLPS